MMPMPPRIAALPQDSRGYPIPWNVLVGPDGPLFAVNNSEKHITALLHGLCPICGKPLGRFKWFVGGPHSAFDPHGWYYDLPGHVECIEYALQVCPYLAVKDYKHQATLLERCKSKLPPGVDAIDETTDPNRPPVFVMVASATIETTQSASASQFPVVRPGLPWLGVKYWKDGKQLSQDEGETIVHSLGLTTTERQQQ